MNVEEIADRLGRALYEREKARDRTLSERMADWDELNYSRKQTRLQNAREIVVMLHGALDLSWEGVEALARFSKRGEAAAGHDRDQDQDRLGRLVHTLEALLPERLSG